MKLQKGIVFGERKFALAVCLVALAGVVHATFYYSGAGEANSAILSTAVKWYSDASLTVVANPQPTPTENDDNTYVFLESKKIQGSYTFPDGTHVWLGTSSKRWSPNCQSILWTIPDCTIYGLNYLVNYGDAGGFAGNYQLVKTGQSIIFGGTNLKDNTLYGVYLSGTFTGESDVLLSAAIGGYSGSGLGGSYARVGFNGDFSGYKGKFDSKA